MLQFDEVCVCVCVLILFTTCFLFGTFCVLELFLILFPFCFVFFTFLTPLQSSRGACCPPSRTSRRTSWASAASTPSRWRTRLPWSWRRGVARSSSSRTRGRSPAGWRRIRLSGTRATTRRRLIACCSTCTGTANVHLKRLWCVKKPLGTISRETRFFRASTSSTAAGSVLAGMTKWRSNSEKQNPAHWLLW